MLIFFFKGIFYAVYFIPPYMYSSPDDVGHISYIQYIADMKSLPVLMQSMLEYNNFINLIFNENNIVTSYLVPQQGNYDIAYQANWIAQHPPLYYALMAPFYGILSYFITDISYVIYILRCITNLFGVLSIYIIHLILTRLNVSKLMYMAVLIAFTFSPSLQFFYTTVSNDSLLMMLCILSVLWVVNFMQIKSKKYFYYFVITCALIILTKYTGVIAVVFYSLLMIYFAYRFYPAKDMIKMVLYGIITAGIMVIPLLAYNYHLYNKLFPTYDSFAKIHNFSFIDFILNKDYFRVISTNIILLLGWIKQLIADRFVLSSVLASLFCLSLPYVKQRPVITYSVLLFSIIFFISTANTAMVQSVLIALFITLSFNVILQKADNNIRLFNAATILTILIFIASFIYSHYLFFNQFGNLYAMNGRYYYVLIFPALYIIFSSLNLINLKYYRILINIILLFFLVLEGYVIIKGFIIW